MFLRYFRSGLRTLKAIRTFFNDFSFKESYAIFDYSKFLNVSPMSASILDKVDDLKHFLAERVDFS